MTSRAAFDFRLQSALAQQFVEFLVEKESDFEVDAALWQRHQANLAKSGDATLDKSGEESAEESGGPEKRLANTVLKVSIAAADVVSCDARSNAAARPAEDARALLEISAMTHALRLSDALPAYCPPPHESPRKDSSVCLDPPPSVLVPPTFKFYFPLGDPSRPHIHRLRAKKCESTGFLKRSPSCMSALDKELLLIAGIDDDLGVQVNESGSLVAPGNVSSRVNQIKLARQSHSFPLADSFWLPERKSLDEMMVDLKACFILDRSNDPSSPPRRPNALYRNEMWPVTTVLCVPRYCSMALFDKVHARRVAAVSIPNSTVEIQEVEEQEEEKFIEFEDVERWWKELTATYHDDHAIVFKIMQKSNMQNYLSPQDFQPIVDEVVQRHPGLEFLSTLAVFQARYAETVITRIFYSKINNCNERMTLAEFRKHAFLELLIKLQLDDDINSTRDVFSYKHFYVIYCKFWELDTDHNMIIEASDMFRYGRGALTDMMMKRVVSGYGKPLALGNASKKISYKDFIWFMLCVEDKRKVGSIEYWFRCLDVDSDGMLSLYELCEFYEQQVKRMIDFRMSEPWKLDDFICSLLDLIKPKNPNYLTLSDLKRTPQNAALFFDMLFDLRKYDNHVRRIDPMYREMDDVWIEEEVVVGSVGGGAGGCLKRVKLEGWDKFAERAYELLAYEEAGGGGDGGGGGGGNADAVDGNGIGGRGSGVGGGVRNLEDDDEEDMEGGHWSCYLGKDDEDEDVDEDEDHDVINGWATELGTSRDEKMHMLDEDEEEEEDVAQGVKRLMSYHSGLSIDEQLLSEAGRENRLRGVKNTRH